MSPQSLIANSICTVLFSRWKEDTWHWAICIPKDDNTARTLHVVQPTQYSDYWFFEDPAREINLATSKTACAVIQIGTLQNMNVYNSVFQLLKEIPMTIPQEDIGIEPKFTCRVWWKQAIRVLSDRGYIKCDNVQALENECKAYAETNDRSQEENEHYIYHVSKNSRSPVS